MWVDINTLSSRTEISCQITPKNIATFCRYGSIGCTEGRARSDYMGRKVYSELILLLTQLLRLCCIAARCMHEYPLHQTSPHTVSLMWSLGYRVRLFPLFALSRSNFGRVAYYRRTVLSLFWLFVRKLSLLCIWAWWEATGYRFESKNSFFSFTPIR